jgi:hypothetical protein
MKGKSILIALGALAGCATAPATPMDAYLNRYAMSESALTHCPAWGGYSSVAAMNSDAQKNLAQAKALGATEKDMQKARARIGATFTTVYALTNQGQACSALINSLAQAGTTVPKVTPAKAEGTQP